MANDGRFLLVLAMSTLIAETAHAQAWNEYLVGVSINSIVWDPYRQVLWFATGSDGVIKFDGTTFTYYDVSNSQLPTNRLTCAVIDLDEKHELWFGTAAQGLVRFNPDAPDTSQWRIYTTAHGLLAAPGAPNQSAYINTLAVDDDGAIWIGTNGSGVNRFDRHNRWDTLTVADGLIGDDVRAIATDREGNRWFGTNAANSAQRGVSRLYCPRDCFRSKPSGPHARLDSSATWSTCLIGKNINAIFIDETGGKLERWFAGNDSVYYLPSTRSDICPQSIPGKPAGVSTFRSIIVDENGFQWFGYSFGAVRLDLSQPNPAQRWKIFNDPTTISTRAINTIARDDDGTLWFGNNNLLGIVKFNANWQTFTSADGLGSNTVGALAEDKSDTIWAGTINGLSKLNNSRWVNYFAGKNIVTIAVDAANGLWLGTDREGAIHVTPPVKTGTAFGDTTFYKQKGSSDCGKKMVVCCLDTNTVNDIAIFNKDVWIATEAGLTLLKPDSIKWQTFNRFKGDLIDNRIQAIAIENDSTIWCGTVAGISRFNPKRETSQNFPTIPLSASNWITDILVESPNKIWFATNGGGASLYQNGRWQTPLTSDNGLADNYVYALKFSQKPLGIWFGTRNGAAFRDKNGILSTFRTQHGLGGNFIFSLLRDQRERIWFGTLVRGVTRYTHKENPPRVRLRNTFDVTTSPEIVYKFEGSDIGTSTPLLRYAYRLNTEKEYSSWTPATFARIVIPRNGLFTFYVKTIDTDGNESKEPATDTFHKIAPDTGSYSRFKYKVGTYGVDSVKITFFWPPYQFQRNPEIDVAPVPADSVDKSTLFAFDLISRDSSLNIFRKPIILTFALPLNDMTKGERWRIFHGFDKKLRKWDLIGGTTKTKDDTVTISTAIQQLGFYALRETIKDSVTISFAVNAQPRIFSPRGGGHGPQTTVSFKLDQREHVRIQVYNLAGRWVNTICDEILSAGVNAVAWDGRDRNRQFCPTGLYIITLESRGFHSPPKPIKVMVLNQ